MIAILEVAETDRSLFHALAGPNPGATDVIANLCKVARSYADYMR